MRPEQKAAFEDLIYANLEDRSVGIEETTLDDVIHDVDLSDQEQSSDFFLNPEEPLKFE